MTFETVKNVLSQAGQHLGDLVYWTLVEARIERATLEKLWAEAQLPANLLPEKPTAEKALKSAVRETQVGQLERLIRLGKEDEAEIVFAIVRENRHADGSVSYNQETRVLFDRKTEAITADDKGHDLVAAITGRFVELRSTHTADDVRRAMMRVLESCAAVTLRNHGGVYWIPAPYAETVRRLQSAIERIGSSRVYLLPVHQSDDAGRTLGDAARSAIEEELAALKAEIEGFLSAPPERVSTLVRRLDAFDALRGRAQLYREILAVQVADLDKTLTDLTDKVEGLLTLKAAA